MLQDLRFALRTFARNPLFTLGAVATLALGIGVNSTIFSLSNAVLFRPTPGVTEPARLAWVSTLHRDRGRVGGMSYPDYLDYRDASRDTFAEMMAFSPTPLSLGSGGEPERIRGHLVTGSYFGGLGVVPAAGRLLGPSDDRLGAASPVVVVSHRLWQRRFSASPELLQQSITINGRQFAVVGVAPERFNGVLLGEAADAWLPMAVWPRLLSSQANALTERGASWLYVMGRLRPGTGIAAAQTTMGVVAARLEAAYPGTNENKSVRVTPAHPLSPQARGEAVPLASLLLIVTALVLLIACANVANLLLARGAGRSLEISIRAAIGASRGRLVRQLLTESALLAAGGAVLGLLLSFWAADILGAMLPAEDFGNLTAGADARVLLFTALLATASVCVFGLLPAWTTTRRAMMVSLRSTPSAGGGRSRLQGAFVVAQLSLSLVLLLAAGLSLRALQKSSVIDLGFNPHQVVTASYDLALQNYPDPRRDTFRRELLARMRALPGVVSASMANVAPLSGTIVGTVVSSTDEQGKPIEGRAALNAVGPEYFETLQIPLVSGRGIAPEDARGAAGAAVVNETLARQLWPGVDPLGRTIRFDDTPLEVVGVARNSKYDEATEDPRAFLYLSLSQHSPLDRETLLIRTSAAPQSIASEIQSQIRLLDPALPVFDVRPLDVVLQDRVDKQRGISTLFAAFGALALVLAALGLYGVMTYAVTRRKREMGVRLALGATPAQLTRLVAGDGVRLALTGVAIGAVLALPLAQVLGALVFGVQVADLATFAATCVLLILVAFAAAAVPARRAGRLDPIAALRSE